MFHFPAIIFTLVGVPIIRTAIYRSVLKGDASNLQNKARTKKPLTTSSGQRPRAVPSSRTLLAPCLHVAPMLRWLGQGDRLHPRLCGMVQQRASLRNSTARPLAAC